MAQEHIDRTLDSTYDRLRPEVAKVQDTIHHPTIQNGACVQGVKPSTEASSPTTTETDRPDKLNPLPTRLPPPLPSPPRVELAAPDPPNECPQPQPTPRNFNLPFRVQKLHDNDELEAQRPRKKRQLENSYSTIANRDASGWYPPASPESLLQQRDEGVGV